MRQKHSDYMHWAKTQSRARFNLATSGVGQLPMRELPFNCARLQINGDNSYGYGPLKNAIAARHEVDPDCVVEAAGTAMANYLAMAAWLDPGDEALIEHPAYALLVEAALSVGADVKRFARTEDSGYALEPEAVRRAITPKTRLIVITNLHNPSGVLTADPVLREIAEIAESVNALLMVDEVYLDAAYENTPRTSFHLGRNVVVTNSLTKVYGLSGLRCGWILAAPDLAERIWHINDLFGNIPPHSAELMSIIALENLSAIAQRSRNLLTANRALLDQFLNSRTDLELLRPPAGTVIFPRLTKGNTAKFIELLREKYETEVVPGRFFEMPDHFRLGIGGETEMLRAGLDRLSSALDEFAGKV